MRRPIETIYFKVGRRVAAARRQARLTQRQLGDAIGFSRLGIVGIESARLRVQLHALAKIAKVCGVSLRELLPTDERE